jgi:hypothetical protein
MRSAPHSWDLMSTVLRGGEKVHCVDLLRSLLYDEDTQALKSDSSSKMLSFKLAGMGVIFNAGGQSSLFADADADVSLLLLNVDTAIPFVFTNGTDNIIYNHIGTFVQRHVTPFRVCAYAILKPNDQLCNATLQMSTFGTPSTRISTSSASKRVLNRFLRHTTAPRPTKRKAPCHCLTCSQNLATLRSSLPPRSSGGRRE